MKGIRFSRKRPAPAAAAQRLRARTSVARVAFSTFVLTALLFVLLGMVLQWLNAREHERVQDDAARAIATDPLGPLPAGIDVVEAAVWTLTASAILSSYEFLTRG